MEAIKGKINLMDNNDTQILLVCDSINFGRFSAHAIKQAVFQIINKGNHPLIIQTVHTGCGCTQAKFDKNLLSLMILLL